MPPPCNSDPASAKINHRPPVPQNHLQSPLPRTLLPGALLSTAGVGQPREAAGPQDSCRRSQGGAQAPRDRLSPPEEDDDGGRLRHRPDQAADAHHAQEGEEGLLAPGTGALSGDHGRALGRAAGEARTAGEILKSRSQPFNRGYLQCLNPKPPVSWSCPIN